MRHFLTISLLGALALPIASAEAQLPKRISQAIKQKVSDRKREMEDSITKRATEPVDSALVRASKVDSLAAKASAKASAMVSTVGRGKQMSAEEKALRGALAAGRLDLTDLAFARGKSDPIISPEALQLLAKVLGDLPNVYLVQGRADAGMAKAAAQKLAEKRALAFKTALVAQGVPAERLFAAGDGSAQPGGALASVLRVQ
ncbi:MAG TPA: OmpA family protein [Gemmatimonadaceae bacterium]|nr:OmpA family protein [Gemmatimonadaceae bacterium]